LLLDIDSIDEANEICPKLLPFHQRFKAFTIVFPSTDEEGKGRKNEPGYFDPGHDGWIDERAPSDCKVQFYNGTERVEVFVFTTL